MSDVHATQLNSPGWIAFTKISFGLSVAAMIGGIALLPATLWVKGYLAMGALFLLGATFTLAKTMRDEFEANKLINKIQDARTDRILKDFDPQAAP
ncbi:MAG: YiaA/YiaB family inner membrane protein [Pseudomonadota bacterium]